MARADDIRQRCERIEAFAGWGPPDKGSDVRILVQEDIPWLLGEIEALSLLIPPSEAAGKESSTNG